MPRNADIDFASVEAHVPVSQQPSRVRSGAQGGVASRYRLTACQRAVKVVRWNRNGDRWATAGADGVVFVWETPQNSMQFKATVGFYANQGNYVNGVAWSPDDTELASVGDANTVRIWNVSTRAQPVTILSKRGLLHEGEQRRLMLNEQRLTDDELAELIRQRSVRSLTASECEQYLRSACPPIP